MSEKAHWTEKPAFGGAQFAACIYPAFVAYHLTWYCTDVALIPPLVTGVLLFGMRLFGALYDNAVGVFINRTQFRDGKYRPYYKWCAVPYAVSLALLCTMPVTSLAARVVYLAVMLIFCAIFNSVIGTATFAMIPYVAKSDVDRTKFVSFCIVCSILTYILIGTFLPPLVEFLGNGDKRVGFPSAMTLLAILAVPLLFAAYFLLKERHFTVAASTATIRELVTTVTQNRRLLFFFAGYGIYATANGFKNQTTYFYLTYNMERLDLLPVVIFAGLASPLAMQVVIPRLLALARKETLLVVGLFGAAGGSLLMAAAGRNPAALIACVVVYGMFTAVFANLVYAVMASFTDEIMESKSIRMSDVLAATMRFSDRVGIAVTGGMVPLVLWLSGYVAPSLEQLAAGQVAEQSATALAGIKALYIFLTAVGLILAGLAMLQLRKSETTA